MTMAETAGQTPAFTGTVKTRLFEQYLTTVGGITDEAVFEISKTGITTRMVDPGEVSLVEAELKFEEFTGEVTDGEFGVTVSDLEDIITGLGNSESVDDPNTGSDGDGSDCQFETVSLEFYPVLETLTVSAGPYSYTHACHHPDSVRDAPDTEYIGFSFTADIPGKTLKQALNWFDGFSSYVDVGYSSDSEVFWMEAKRIAEADDRSTDTGVFELPQSKFETVRKTGDVESCFSLEYLMDVVEIIPPDATVTICVDGDFPIRLSYTLSDGAPAGGSEEVSNESETGSGSEIMLMVAPRIEHDE